MVAETGEATARFLRSIAEGEFDQKAELEQRAALGMERVRSMRPADEPGRPGNAHAVSHELVRPASFPLLLQSHTPREGRGGRISPPRHGIAWCQRLGSM